MIWFLSIITANLLVIFILVKRRNDNQKKIISSSNRVKLLQKQLAVVEENNTIISLEIRKLSKQLKQTKRLLFKLRAANAHDVRGPLARILGIAFLTKKDAEQRLIEKCQYFELIETNARQIDDILKQINRDIDIALKRR